MAKSKRQKRLEKYGNVQQTVPMLMPETRYQAFKRLIFGNGQDINKVIRDLIEEAYGEDLTQIEQRIILDSDVQESTHVSKDAERKVS